MGELEPCPFCGGEAEWKSGGPGCAWVSCKECPAETGDGSIDRIKAAWNRRAIPAADVLAERDALRAKVARLETQVAALEWFGETSAEAALTVKKHLDDLNRRAALTDGGEDA